MKAEFARGGFGALLVVTVKDMDSPGHRLHPLTGDRKGEWAVDVSGNWRITFRFDGREFHDVNYEDYP